MPVNELPEPDEYTPDRGAMWNTYPFVGQNGRDITLGASCEWVYYLSVSEARETAAHLLAAAARAEAQP
jgi:hypothetical protein